jgi:regulator of RNase E activity RraA
VEIGGAHVKPGDLVVADGDRAIAVPQDVIDDVLKYAMQESENDRYDRRMLFDILKIPHDESLNQSLTCRLDISHLTSLRSGSALKTKISQPIDARLSV